MNVGLLIALFVACVGLALGFGGGGGYGGGDDY